jgi:hypothetical protein
VDKKPLSISSGKTITKRKIAIIVLAALLAPFLISAMIHLSIVVFGLSMLKAKRTVPPAPPSPPIRMEISPDEIRDGPPGGVPNIGLGSDPLKDALRKFRSSETRPSTQHAATDESSVSHKSR